MKKALMLLLLLYCTATGFAKELAKIQVNILNKELHQIAPMNAFVQTSLNAYQPVKTDTLERGIEYSYTDGEDLLRVKYIYEPDAGNADLKIPHKKLVRNIRINGQFLSVLKLYNDLFGDELTYETFQPKGPAGEIEPLPDSLPVGARLWYFFERDTTREGYWNMNLWMSKR